MSQTLCGYTFHATQCEYKLASTWTCSGTLCAVTENSSLLEKMNLQPFQCAWRHVGTDLLSFCRTWTKRYLITSQTRVKCVSRIHHRTIFRQKLKQTLRVGGPQLPLSISSSFIIFFVLLPFCLKTKITDLLTHNLCIPPPPPPPPPPQRQLALVQPQMLALHWPARINLWGHFLRGYSNSHLYALSFRTSVPSMFPPTMTCSIKYRKRWSSAKLWGICFPGSSTRTVSATSSICTKCGLFRKSSKKTLLLFFLSSSIWPLLVTADNLLVSCVFPCVVFWPDLILLNFWFFLFNYALFTITWTKGPSQKFAEAEWDEQN